MPRRSTSSLVLTFLGITLLILNEQNYAYPAQSDARALEPGAPIERELRGGDAHSYRVVLSSGQYLRVVVDQRGIDVVGVLRGPDGMQLMEMDGITGPLGAEELSWEAASGGGYMLEVRAKAKQANTGRYEVKVEKAPEATDKDRARVAAERLYMEGRRAQGEGRGEALERAIKKYEEAVEKWRGAGERKWEALTLNNLGGVYYSLSQHEKARDYFEQVLAIRREIKDRRGEGGTLNNLGVVYERLSQHEKARDYYEQSLAIRREIKDRSGEGGTLTNLGGVYYNLSQYEKARDYYEQSLAISREIKDRRGEGLTLTNLGSVYKNLSQNEKAREYYEQALAIRREIKDRSGEGFALNGLGGVYYSLSQNEKARDYFEQALAIRREIKDRRGEGGALTNLGNVYGNLSQNEKARDYYEQSLAIRREIKDRFGEGLTLNALGNVYFNLSQNEKAREYYEQALAISREIKNRNGEGYALNGLGGVYYALSQYEKARDYYEQALAIRREIKDSGGEAETLFHLASFKRDRGDLSEARTRIESALAIIESLRATYSNQEFRSAYFATVQNSYEFYIDLLMRLHKQDPAAGHDAAALQASERARARTLLETLSEASADIRQGVDPELVERERSLQRQLNLKAQQQVKLLGGQHTAEQAAASAREIEALTGEYQQLQAQIRRTSPRYAALTQPQPLSLKEIQQQVLDADTLLLEYALGDERSYLWAVTPTSMTSYELPKRTDLESAARSFYQAAKTDNADAEAMRAAATLSQMLLSPVAGQLGSKRLVIVADGALQFVPFAALPVPGAKSAASRPLILEHEIVSLPSVSTLAVLRRETMGRPRAIRAVAVLADPVFDANDQRVRGAKLQGAGGSSEASAGSGKTRGMEPQLERSVQESGIANNDARLPRLIGTRREALGILSLVPAGEQKRALDFEASRATAMSAELGQYRFIHFATHGLLNSAHPELSGVVLSLVDDRGQAVDGFLRLHEIYNLRLPAELVVLSACQTGLGKEIRGEGLVGLTRGFMYAGSPRVMASLWKVDDRATTELMKRFYEGMLGPKRLRPAAALRGAQVSMWKQKRWQSPYYWAAFVLQGEWR